MSSGYYEDSLNSNGHQFHIKINKTNNLCLCTFVCRHENRANSTHITITNLTQTKKKKIYHIDRTVATSISKRNILETEQNRFL